MKNKDIHNYYYYYYHYHYFKSRLSLIIQVNVVLNRIVVVDSDWRFDNLCSSQLQSPSELYHFSWWYYTLLVDYVAMLLVECQLSRNVIGYEDSLCNRCVLIRLLSQSNSHPFLVKLSVVQSFSHSLFCLILPISCLYGAGNCWLQFSGICSKLSIKATFLRWDVDSSR